MDLLRLVVLTNSDLALDLYVLLQNAAPFRALTERNRMFQLTPESVIRPYEAVILMDPNSSEEEQKSLFAKNKKTLEAFSGQIHNVDTWGVRKLGNPIEKFSRAIYFHCTFMAAPDAISELERTMRINDRVLRFMHTRLPETTVLSDYMTKFKEALIERKEKDAKRALAKAKRPPR